MITPSLNHNKHLLERDMRHRDIWARIFFACMFAGVALIFYTMTHGKETLTAFLCGVELTLILTAAWAFNRKWGSL